MHGHCPHGPKAKHKGFTSGRCLIRLGKNEIINGSLPPLCLCFAVCKTTMLKAACKWLSFGGVCACLGCILIDRKMVILSFMTGRFSQWGNLQSGATLLCWNPDAATYMLFGLFNFFSFIWKWKWLYLFYRVVLVHSYLNCIDYCGKSSY